MNKYKYDGSRKFKISDFDCADTGEFKERHKAVREFVNNLELINEYQQKIFAEKKEGIIFVFQAMDAAGKDGAVRAVLSCLSPQGVSEHSFKKPSAEENAHDYLWRFWKALPEKGNISIFNRSHYEDVLVQRVHKYYMSNKFADRIDKSKIIEQRYEQINAFEKYLWENSFRVIKIFLNVSKDEQARRFISRVDTPKKNWKFSSSDIEERAYWDDYMEAFECCINNTAKKNTPWYVVPADHKWYARLIISRIILDELKNMKPQWPVLEEDEMNKLESYKAKLVLETGIENLKTDRESKKGFDIKPASLAMYQAMNADWVALSKNETEQTIRENALAVFKNHADIDTRNLEELAAVYQKYIELSIADELENTSFLTSGYNNLKKDLKKVLKGNGKEGRKLVNRFKKDCKAYAKQYEESIKNIYGSYQGDIEKITEKCGKNLTKKTPPENIAKIFEDDIRKLYNRIKKESEKALKDIYFDIVNTHDDYLKLAEAFRSNKKVDVALEKVLVQEAEEVLTKKKSKKAKKVKSEETEEV